MARRGNRSSVVGVVLLVGLAVLVVKWLLITAVILVVPFGAWWLWDRTRRPDPGRAGSARADTTDPRRRARLEGLAVVDAAGGCGWCGSRVAHLDRLGYPVLPRDAHRDDIEQALRIPA